MAYGDREDADRPGIAIGSNGGVELETTKVWRLPALAGRSSPRGAVPTMGPPGQAVGAYGPAIEGIEALSDRDVASARFEDTIQEEQQ